MTNFELAADIGQPCFATKGAWFRVTSGRKDIGLQGRLMWLGITGSPRALASSPDRLRVERVGLAVEGRTGLVFFDAARVTPIERKITADELAAIEIFTRTIPAAGIRFAA